MEVQHQLINQDFFFPDWKIKHLFLGTFNPNGGQEVRYFYGRHSNYTWLLLTEIFGINFRELLDNDFNSFINELKNNSIACMDMIKSIEFNENEVDINNIIGNGYKDSNIINNSVIRHYNTESIQKVIANNQNVKIYSTWGRGSALMNWVNEVDLIQNRINLTSPSRAARVPLGVDKFQYILNDWNNKIIL